MLSIHSSSLSVMSQSVTARVMSGSVIVWFTPSEHVQSIGNAVHESLHSGQQWCPRPPEIYQCSPSLTVSILPVLTSQHSHLSHYWTPRSWSQGWTTRPRVSQDHCFQLLLEQPEDTIRSLKFHALQLQTLPHRCSPRTETLGQRHGFAAGLQHHDR